MVEPGSDCRLRPTLAALMNALIPNPRMIRSRIIWPATTNRAVSLVAVISPNPTVEKIVTVKYSASVRVRSSWLKFPVPNVDIRKYVGREQEQEQRDRRRQRLDRPDAGKSERMIRRISHTTTATNTTDPRTTRSHADNRQAPSTGAT